MLSSMLNPIKSSFFSLGKLILVALTTLVLSGCNLTVDEKTKIAEEKTSPFSSLTFRGEQLIVDIDGSQYTWLKIDTIEVAQLVSLFKENFETKWQKRISEDFVEYSNKLDIYYKKEESLTLLDKNQNEVILSVKFNGQKRQLAQEFYEEQYDKEIEIKRLLSKDEILEDVQQLEKLITDNYSYYFLNSVNIKKEIEGIYNSLSDGTSTYDFALALNGFINKFGDAHSRIRNVSFKEKGQLPFSTSLFKDHVVCHKGDSILYNNYPFLHSINGVKVDQLLRISDLYLTSHASPQYRKRRKVNRLNRIGLILDKAKAFDSELTIVLTNKDGDFKTFKSAIAVFKDNASNQNEASNPYETRLIGDIGYLKIKSMESLKDPINYNDAISAISSSKAIIIDVRGNGGGKRDILMELAPQFIDSSQNFVIGNFTRLRTDSPNKNKSLDDRYLYQPGDIKFSQLENTKISNVIVSFVPSISLSEKKYSPYYVLHIKGDSKPQFADVPTVVLMDEGCFSATDIFLSSFKEIDDVTLIGTKSGGGSGRVNKYKLNNSAIELSLSTIASFQPSGALYDGIGVSPDITIEKENLSDLTGTTDNQLDFAVQYLSKKVN